MTDAWSLLDLVCGERVVVIAPFRDLDGTLWAAGTTLTYLSRAYFPYDDGHTFHFREGTIRLCGLYPDQEAVVRMAHTVLRREPADPR